MTVSRVSLFFLLSYYLWISRSALLKKEEASVNTQKPKRHSFFEIRKITHDSPLNDTSEISSLTSHLFLRGWKARDTRWTRRSRWESVENSEISSFCGFFFRDYFNFDCKLFQSRNVCYFSFLTFRYQSVIDNGMSGWVKAAFTWGCNWMREKRQKQKQTYTIRQCTHLQITGSSFSLHKRGANVEKVASSSSQRCQL